MTPSCRGFLEVGLDANPSKKKKDKDKDKELNKNKYEGDDISFSDNDGNSNGKKTVERYNHEYRYGRRRGVWKTRTEIPYIHAEITDITRIESKIDNDNKKINIDVNDNQNENKNEVESVSYFKEECIDVKDTTIKNTDLDINEKLINEVKLEMKVGKDVDYTTTPSYRLFLSQWLVGKYVTVMWLKNMRYSEAIVGDYNTEKGQFPLCLEIE